MPDAIDRPCVGTVITGMEHVRISCRKKIDGPHKIRQTGEHHAFLYSAKGNVIITVEKSYIRNRCSR